MLYRIGYGVNNDYTPLDFLAYIARKLDEADTPERGRFVEVPYSFISYLSREGRFIFEEGLSKHGRLHGLYVVTLPDILLKENTIRVLATNTRIEYNIKLGDEY